MSYRVEVDFAPAYELVMSLDAYVVVPSHRSMDLGDTWVPQVREQLSPTLRGQLEALTEPLDFGLLGLLVQQCPGDRTATGFVDWLAKLGIGELYERLAPARLPADLGAFRDQSVTLLSAWNAEYFSRMDGAILTHLAAQAAGDGALATQLPPMEAVERITNGIWVAPADGLGTVRLIPQYHKRPIPLSTTADGVLTFFYPAPDLPPMAGQPGTDLLRVVRALADESRLRILYELARGPRTFMELVAASSLTKGTVHRHLWALRFAGLVRVDFHANTFTLRPGAFELISKMLNKFVSNEKEG